MKLRKFKIQKRKNIRVNFKKILNYKIIENSKTKYRYVTEILNAKEAN